MITLYQPKRAFGLPCPSAFCVKLETYLRMADIPYEIAEGIPTAAPKGKVPWIDDDGHVLGDSTFIIRYLKEKYGDTVDGHLSAKQHALGHAIKALLEDSLYFIASYSKWADDASFKIYADELFAGMPEEQLKTVPDWVRKKALEKFASQGIGRHSADEIYAMGVRDLEAFAEFLEEDGFLFGDKATSYDAVALGVIGNLKDGPFPSPVQDAARNSAKVAGYLNRLRAHYFSDL